MSQVLMETDASGSPRAYYVYGIGLISRIGAGSTPDYGYYHFNQVGSIVAVSDHDGTSLTHQYSYSPFGEVIASNVPSGDQNPFCFAGIYGVMTEDCGWLFMRARYYDMLIGRFLSEDPVWGTNLYEYAINNPLLHGDPDGRKAKRNVFKGFWEDVVVQTADVYSRQEYQDAYVYTLSLGNLRADRVDENVALGQAMAKDLAAYVYPASKPMCGVVDEVFILGKAAYNKLSWEDAAQLGYSKAWDALPTKSMPASNTSYWVLKKLLREQQLR